MKLFSLSLRYVLVVADFLGAGKFVKILFILGIVRIYVARGSKVNTGFILLSFSACFTKLTTL